MCSLDLGLPSCCPNGQVRLCLDPTKLNENLIQPVYASLKVKDVMTKLKGVRYASILDANHAF